MAVKVLKGTVKANGKTYSKDEIITGLSEKDEAGLVFKGVAEYIAVHIELISEQPEQPEQPNQSEVPETTSEPEHEHEQETEQEPGQDQEVNIDFDPDELVVQKDKAKTGKRTGK